VPPSKSPSSNRRPKPSSKGRRSTKRGWAFRLLRLLLLTLIGYLGILCLLLCVYRFVDPPITGVQLQRRMEALFASRDVANRQTMLPVSRISPHLAHAVIAAEDGNFYKHWGFDFGQIQRAIQYDLLEEGRPRGASTITQQLVKNLFFTTHAFPPRKVLEVILTPVAEVALGKDRILELYLNVAEWGPGVYGAEAASRYHFRKPAAQLTRAEAARLAAILPSPRKRKPASMNRYSSIILERMTYLGY